jgi:hypothetical protein
MTGLPFILVRTGGGCTEASWDSVSPQRRRGTEGDRVCLFVRSESYRSASIFNHSAGEEMGDFARKARNGLGQPAKAVLRISSVPLCLCGENGFGACPLHPGLNKAVPQSKPTSDSPLFQPASPARPGAPDLPCGLEPVRRFRRSGCQSNSDSRTRTEQTWRW